MDFPVKHTGNSRKVLKLTQLSPSDNAISLIRGQTAESEIIKYSQHVPLQTGHTSYKHTLKLQKRHFIRGGLLNTFTQCLNLSVYKVNFNIICLAWASGSYIYIEFPIYM